MADLHFPTHLFLYILSPVLLLILFLTIVFVKSNNRNSGKVPASYPIIGSLFAILKHKHRRVQWLSEIIISTPNLTFTLHRPFGYLQIFTANPANVQHILKSHFHEYPKGEVATSSLRAFLGDGIFNSDGETWKFQRQVSSHQFNTRSLRTFVENVVDSELSDRLIPILENAAENKTVLDLQDILQRFAFDNVCKIAFGYDPAYLSPSLPEIRFAKVFDNTLKLISERFSASIPVTWKIKRALNIGSERELKLAVNEIRTFAKQIIRDKRQEIEQKASTGENALVDLLSRFINPGHSDEDFVTDIVISFIMAGRDTTSAALTWFFWLIFKNPDVEMEILKEIESSSESDRVYDELKNMAYTHASLCESMRLYPPVPASTKSALNDDVLPDGTKVKQGTRVTYHPYAMGRVEEVWGVDWAEFRPDRWMEKGSFVGRDPFTYPVFQAGPRVCLGKEMAFLQMKAVVAGVLRRFTVAPVVEEFEPVYVSDFTAKMKGGFLVKIQERD